MRHKTNWERVLSAIDSITGKCNAASLKCHKRRQAAKAGNSKTTKAEG